MNYSEELLKAIESTSSIEWFAVLTSVIYVILAAQRKILCWLFGLLSSGVYVYLCVSTNLYLESSLQIFYVIMSFYGWITWNKKGNAELHISVWKIRKHIFFLAAGLIITFFLGLTFDHYTDQASPYLDSSITTFSLLATYMTTRKILENWIYWVVVDFCAIFLYASRELFLSSLLYILFTIMAVYGLIAWTKQMKKDQLNQPGATGNL